MYRPNSIDHLVELVGKKQENHTNTSHSYYIDNLLSPSQHIIVYHETFSQLCHYVAGWTYQDADQWRRKLNIDKKQHFPSFEKELRAGIKKASVLPADQTAALLLLIHHTAHILFIKSHAISYTIAAYWFAYYQLYHPQLVEEAIREHPLK